MNDNNDQSEEMYSEKNVQFLRYLDRHEKSKKLRAVLWRLLILSAMVFILMKVDFGSLKLPAVNETSLATVSLGGTQLRMPQCDAMLPPNGSTYMLNPSVMRRSDVTYSGLELVNEHNSPLVIQVSNPDRQIGYQVVSVHSNSTATISLPIGSYGLTIMAGHTWCNLQTGFTDGKKVIVNNSIEIQPGVTNELKIESIGPEVEDFHLVTTQVQPQRPEKALPMQVDGNGVAELRQASGGNYYINGSIGSFPVVFQVDTGASITSIPSEIARNTGIYTCSNRSFNTANGAVIGCVAVVPELTFGNFRISNVEVAVMPNMKESLLGMNVLSHIKMEHSDGVMRIYSTSAPSIQNPYNYSPPIQIRRPVVQPEVVAEQYPSYTPMQPQQQDTSSRRAQLEAGCKQSYDGIKGVIDARMRQGYSAQEGELLREQMRQAENRYRECRNRL